MWKNEEAIIRRKKRRRLSSSSSSEGDARLLVVVDYINSFIASLTLISKKKIYSDALPDPDALPLRLRERFDACEALWLRLLLVRVPLLVWLP